jgi:hypothetical protein
MPEIEWDEKKKKYQTIDWKGNPMTEAQIAQAGKETNYNYDLRNIGRYLPGDASPDTRAAAIADMQKGLQTQFYGSTGLPGEYINKERALGVAGINAAASNYAADKGVLQARGAGAEAADISGRHSTMAAESEASNFMKYLTGQTGGDITKAGRVGGDFDNRPAPTGRAAMPGVNVDNRMIVEKPGMGRPRSQKYEDLELDYGKRKAVSRYLRKKYPEAYEDWWQ